MNPQNTTQTDDDIREQFDEIDFTPTSDGRTDYDEESGVGNEGTLVTPYIVEQEITELETKMEQAG